MKRTFLILFSFALFSSSSFSQSIVGEWNYNNTDGNMKFQFQPIQQNGYGYYEVTYSNGYVYKDYYQLQGQQLGLARFNNGQDQYYSIMQLDANKLVLQDQNLVQYHMVKGMPNMANNANTNNNTNANRNNASPAPVKSPYKVTDPTILAQAAGQAFTEGDFQKNLQLLEFIISARLDAGDLARVKADNLKEFKKDPANFLKQVREANAQMQQLYQLTEPNQVALAQSAMLAQIYPVVLKDPENQDFVQLVNKYNRVLSYDQANSVALTIQDVDALINITNFYNQLKGLNIDFSEQERKKMITAFSNNFQSLPLDQKRGLCAADGLFNYLYGNYQRMNAQEKEQFRQQVLGQQQQPQQNNYNQSTASNRDFANGTSAHLQYIEDGLARTGKLDEKELALYKSARASNQSFYNTMQNMQMESHVTTMNIIENMGPSPNYWEVKYDNY